LIHGTLTNNNRAINPALFSWMYTSFFPRYFARLVTRQQASCFW